MRCRGGAWRCFSRAVERKDPQGRPENGAPGVELAVTEEGTGRGRGIAEPKRAGIGKGPLENSETHAQFHCEREKSRKGKGRGLNSSREPKLNYMACASTLLRGRMGPLAGKGRGGNLVRKLRHRLSESQWGQAHTRGKEKFPSKKTWGGKEPYRRERNILVEKIKEASHALKDFRQSKGVQDEICHLIGTAQEGEKVCKPRHQN